MIDPINPPIIIKGGKKNIPKNPHIFSTCPVIFETKKQYVNEYIKNQEKVRGVDFPKKQEDKFRKEELKKMQPVCARYTTKSNLFMPPRMVIFTDNKISPDRLQEMVQHEQRHQAWEPFDSGPSKDMRVKKKVNVPIFKDFFSKNMVPIDKAKYITMYHGTSQARVPSIKKEGISATQREGEGKGAFVGRQRDTQYYSKQASHRDNSNPAIIKVTLLREQVPDEIVDSIKYKRGIDDFGVEEGISKENIKEDDYNKAIRKIEMEKIKYGSHDFMNRERDEKVKEAMEHMYKGDDIEPDESSKNLIDDVIERKKEEKRQLEQATYEDPRMRERYPNLYARKSDVPKEKYSVINTSEMTPEEHLKFLERYDTLYADYIREKRREMELKKESQVKRTGYI